MTAKTDKSNSSHDDSHTTKPAPAEAITPTTPRPRFHALKVIRLTLLIAVSLVLLGGIAAYAFTPAAIRKPAYQHYHFRVQVVQGGKAVNFGAPAFQEGYSKDNCSADLTAHPFHFHDKRDQLAHVHWDNMTGGLFLKYYGWNLIGGPGATLGYRFDQLPKITSVPIHGKVLPGLGDSDRLYIYTGDKDHHTARNTDDFLRQDFETFFKKRSNLGQEQTSWLEQLLPKAYAHNGEDHSTGDSDMHAEAELEAVNNLLGNIVIFAQKDRPDDSEVKARFDHLAPLEASICGG